jgi:pantetheine-phosphate adenylyltransferase
LTKIAIYPGTFDPLTNGHLDIIKRGLKIFDKIVVLLARNSQKKTFFSLQERVDQVRKVIKDEGLDDKVIVDCFEGLLVHYCKENGIHVIIRGLRPLVDFEYEFEMAMVNRELDSDIETIFILTDQEYFYLRSTLLKDVVNLGGDALKWIPDCIKDDVIKKIRNE